MVLLPSHLITHACKCNSTSAWKSLSDLIGDSAIPDDRTFELKTSIRGQVAYVTRERSDALQICFALTYSPQGSCSSKNLKVAVRWLALMELQQATVYSEEGVSFIFHR